jgi:uncharacterized protein (DUF58 family)
MSAGMTSAAAPGLSFNELFGPDFLTALSRFSLTARRVSAGGRHGERLSKDLGSGIEFRDYRPYSPGDDLRAIDWNIYRRLGKLSLRLFEEQKDLPIYLMPDVSGSMFEGSPPRLVPALRCALALAVIGLNQHDSTGLFPFGSELKVVFKSKSGKASVMPVARHLAQLIDAGAGEQTRLAEAVKKVAALKLRRGLLVIVSDFFDPSGIEALRQALRPVRHRLMFVQLVRKTDANPELQGDLRLKDSEHAGVVDLTITPSVLERYKAAYRNFNVQLETLARQRQGTLIKVDADEDVLEQLSAFFARGDFSV